MGYRLRAQVPVAGYYIDFVIEGDGDRRLAIELDGDDYHGPDRWAADIRRQKMLERLGLTFWRCWGSSWYVDPDGHSADLMETLKHLEIEPIGVFPITMPAPDHVADPQALEITQRAGPTRLGISTMTLLPTGGSAGPAPRCLRR